MSRTRITEKEIPSYSQLNAVSDVSDSDKLKIFFYEMRKTTYTHTQKNMIEYIDAIRKITLNAPPLAIFQIYIFQLNLAKKY